MDEQFSAISFSQDILTLIDQRILPETYDFFTCRNCEDVEYAIRDMVVRGAPAIGAVAAYGVYFAARDLIKTEPGDPVFLDKLHNACDFLEHARPTAVNLHWAVKRMYDLAVKKNQLNREKFLSVLLQEAAKIQDEDVRINKEISRIGSTIIPRKATILTHCNTGALATAGWGTALGVIKHAFYQGKEIFVYADETRPRLQGARLTAWELMQAKIPSKLIVDSAAATLIRDGKIDCVILGGDRVAANGDVCNKIGTFMLSVICKMYGVPFYSVVPISTIDFSINDGSEIPIEEREASEITHPGGIQIAPEGMEVFNPAFDVTPHQNITGIITEAGILRPPYQESIGALKDKFFH